MKGALKFLIALAAMTVIMLAFRALAFTVYTVNGTGFEPNFADGDRVLVNRWSYGLRTGDGKLFGYDRWCAAQPERGDVLAFNRPDSTDAAISSLPVCICFCQAVPGDSVSIDGVTLHIPGKERIVRVTPENIRLINYLYNRYERRKAEVKDGQLLVDGTPTRCADFKNDYYWMYSGRLDNMNDSRFFGLVPENHIIGKVSMLLYSIDNDMPFYNCLRTDRWMLFID